MSTLIKTIDHTKIITKTYEETVGKKCMISKDEEGYSASITTAGDKFIPTYYIPMEFALEIAEAIVKDLSTEEFKRHWTKMMG